jgi:hypothetical protein
MKIKLPLVILIVICFILLIGFVKKMNQVNDLVSDLSMSNSDLAKLEKENEQLKLDLENKSDLYDKVKRERDELEIQLLSMNLYSQKVYNNGVLVESNVGFAEVLEACKKKVDDLEWQLRNCR